MDKINRFGSDVDRYVGNIGGICDLWIIENQLRFCVDGVVWIGQKSRQEGIRQGRTVNT